MQNFCFVCIRDATDPALICKLLQKLELTDVKRLAFIDDEKKVTVEGWLDNRNETKSLCLELAHVAKEFGAGSVQYLY